MSFRILSLDGGGIRGIVPALVLAEMEQRSGRHVADMFDLIAGTSTGGILALGLAAPDGTGQPKFSAADLVGLYEKDGQKIFSRSAWHRMRALGNTLEERYPSAGIEATLASRFGNTWLSEALTNVLVTAYDIELRQPHFFKSSKAKDKSTQGRRDYLMADVGRATSAAPTYFEPALIRSRNAQEDPVALVDGGVFANNPGACALVEAICNHQANPAEVVMLSLGTGEMTRPIMHAEAKGWGLARWAQPILNVVFDGVSDTVDFQVGAILDATQTSEYLRLQTVLHEGNDDMDDASATNVKVLKLLAKDLINKHSKEIDQMLSWL